MKNLKNMKASKSHYWVMRQKSKFSCLHSCSGKPDKSHHPHITHFAPILRKVPRIRCRQIQILA